MPKDKSGNQLAAPNGLWITKSDAIKTYHIAASDLDGIRPISVKRNPHGGPYPVKNYNLSDVQALAHALSSSAASSSTPARVSAAGERLAAANGRRIMRTTAMREYKLKGVQLDRIDPVSIEPNPHRSNTTMTFYNLCDVQKLANDVESAVASMSSR